MKKTATLLKMSLVGLILITGLNASAQVDLIKLDDPATLQPPLSGMGTEAIFVYGGTGFTLTASTTSTSVGGESGIEFTDFDWLFRTAAGGGSDVSSLPTPTTATPGGTANSQLSVTGLAPGFYTFIAQGTTAGEICSADEEEFTVFVLPPLTVTVTLGGDASALYCEDEMAANTLTATAEFDTNVAWNTETDLSDDNPVLSDFELRYRWYKVADGATFDIETATLINQATPTENTTENIYAFEEDDTAPDDNEVGKWNYYVAVDYTVKPSGPYTNALGGATPTVIEVTAKPGKPTISIQPNP